MMILLFVVIMKIIIIITIFILFLIFFSSAHINSKSFPQLLKQRYHAERRAFACLWLDWIAPQWTITSLIQGLHCRHRKEEFSKSNGAIYRSSCVSSKPPPSQLLLQTRAGEMRDAHWLSTGKIPSCA